MSTLSAYGSRFRSKNMAVLVLWAPYSISSHWEAWPQESQRPLLALVSLWQFHLFFSGLSLLISLSLWLTLQLVLWNWLNRTMWSTVTWGAMTEQEGDPLSKTQSWRASLRRWLLCSGQGYQRYWRKRVLQWSGGHIEVKYNSDWVSRVPRIERENLGRRKIHWMSMV